MPFASDLVSRSAKPQAPPFFVVVQRTKAPCTSSLTAAARPSGSFDSLSAFTRSISACRSSASTLQGPAGPGSATGGGATMALADADTGGGGGAAEGAAVAVVGPCTGVCACSPPHAACSTSAKGAVATRRSERCDCMAARSIPRRRDRTSRYLTTSAMVRG